MFIREIKKKNPDSDRVFMYHRLMESVRTPKGPRQRIVLNLGRLDLPREDWKTLANRIEEIVSGQQSLISLSAHIEEQAQHYARLLRRKEMQSVCVLEEEEADWERVDINSVSQGECRTIGGEAVAYAAFEKLGLTEVLSEIGLKKGQIHKAALLVIGRLLHPASERKTALWGKRISGLEELLGADFQYLSNNALYRLSDQLVEYREEIERRLAQRERGIFGLGEKIILYDLTNTYLTGRAHESSKARFGRSKQKRSDCPLVTLALVLDEDGFPKASRVFPGNVGEPGTLREILKELQADRSLFPPTVVMDAGVATEENIELIRQAGYHYVCVSRSRPKESHQEGLMVIKEEDACTIRVKKLTNDEEVILYCQSSLRLQKEESMKARLQKRFEEGLESISDSLKKKRGIKSHDRVLQRLGRLREKYPSINQFYRIEVEHEGGIVQRITWSIDEQERLQARFSGSYYIRSDRSDLNEKELFSLYTMLTQVEDAFRSLKSELGMRPVYHRKDRRMEGHLFITVLAYHLLASIQRDLKNKGISHRWSTIRTQLATQMRATVSLSNDQGERIHIRQTTDPEPFHLQIYRALGLPPKCLRSRRVKM